MTSSKFESKKILKQLAYINYALEQRKADISVSEFHGIYTEMVDQIKAMAIEMDSTYLAKKAILYPTISLDELQNIKSLTNRQDNAAFFQVLVGPIIALFFALIPTKRNKKTKQFKEKETMILDLNTSVRNVLENPGIDKLLKR